MSLLACALSVLAAIVAAFTDARTGRIPNWLTLPLLGVGPLVAAFHGGLSALLFSVLGALVCGLVPLLLFARNAMGGGDVKLFAALGGLLGWDLGLEVQFFSFCAVAFVLLARMAWDGRLFATLKNVVIAGGHLFLPARFHRPLEPQLMTQVRMGVSILLGTLASVAMRAPFSPWMP